MPKNQVTPALPDLVESEMRMAVLTFSRIAIDRRVQRQCAVLADMGYAPLVIAYGSAEDRMPYVHEYYPVPRATLMHRLKTLAFQLPSHLGAWAARLGFWAEPRHRWALDRLRYHSPRIVIANDFPALVVACAYKAETGALVHYDSHEFATLEFDESALWRLVYKPFVTHLERAYIGASDSVSTVGPSLAKALQDRYALKNRPVVIRSTPEAIALPETTPTQWPLRVLYHGNVSPNRGIEELISSVTLWNEPHGLIIRGDSKPAYLAQLRQLAAATGRSDRIVFEAALPPEEVMSVAARTADLGVFFTSLETIQRNFVMPNKLFEYIGAGLAVAISPATDMKAIVEQFQIGVISSDAGVAAIAAAMNGLTHEGVTIFKENARTAARTLCWENERLILRNVISALVDRASEDSANRVPSNY